MSFDDFLADEAASRDESKKADAFDIFDNFGFGNQQNVFEAVDEANASQIPAKDEFMRNQGETAEMDKARMAKLLDVNAAPEGPEKPEYNDLPSYK
jgi:Skp family chaperone for outer membrane proteins